ncbi:nitroreductase family deazaflavin-dependent oxidoreductase [Salinibacterium sp. G-O1]|uniref:nitroreductase family deazaflavin-dependent oxidoreductase n=1 Tax=Salinibacterium sp. G-O1 TaxID=3046208 RepID=UPI0024B90125|nr:nitroreductase family deazaflavin-dependent oxidoreductase [Salinibacterium sp. G-O1]MDJ0334457.1 nitroreductase family deazaflavin-dependent oxidoreductase [Salinibacterium sp. G-O1]
MSVAARLLRTRWLMRAPIGMFRIGLGFLFGERLLLLEHIGRTSGKARYVVLETVSRPTPNEILVASGFGTRSQWLQNLRANAQCFVSIGRIRRSPAVSEILDDESARRALAGYALEHPKAWQQLNALMGELAGTANPEIPVVRLTLPTRGGSSQ